uniref:Uncharacterized protein n=1 Tax=Cannabis sativa TaxID=3483 RepID=A0A803PSY1_CANSA
MCPAGPVSVHLKRQVAEDLTSGVVKSRFGNPESRSSREGLVRRSGLALLVRPPLTESRLGEKLSSSEVNQPSNAAASGPVRLAIRAN